MDSREIMTSRDIAHHRLVNQRIIGSNFSKPEEVVRWMGCMQAQDFSQAKWAIAIRMKEITESEIDQAFDKGRILRTHILRPTWHFVLPEDIGWILRLTAPKIKAFNKSLHQKLGIDDKILRRSKNIMVKALTDGKQLTREHLLKLLKNAKINTDDIRINFMLMDAELDGIICSGPRQGKQFTYTLLEEKVPEIESDRDTGIKQLADRYFSSRGPATLQDFSWWSGLNGSDAKKGIEMNKHRLASRVINGQAYWFSNELPLPALPASESAQKQKNVVHLLPAFDEYAVSYKDRSDILPAAYYKRSGNGIFKPPLSVNGQIAGVWKRAITGGKLHIVTEPFAALNRSTHHLAEKAAKNYARFIEKTFIGFEQA